MSSPSLDKELQSPRPILLLHLYLTPLVKNLMGVRQHDGVSGV